VKLIQIQILETNKADVGKDYENRTNSAAEEMNLPADR